MSSSVPPTQLIPSEASLLGPGIAGLFIQGLESGLVFAQLSQWFYASDRTEGSLLSTIVIFVTLVGLCASRNFTVRLQINYLFPFTKRAVRSGLCICLVSVRTALWGVRTCGLSISYCAGNAHLTLESRLRCSQAGRITFSQSQYVENLSCFILVAPNPVCRPCSCRLPSKL